MMRIGYKFTVLLILFAALLIHKGARAGGTRIWELAGFEELNQGEMDGTLVSSKGEVSLGYQKNKLDLPDIGLVWSAVRDKDGTIYLGSGYDGQIFRVRETRVERIATTDQLVITSLAIDSRGTLFAAGLPDPIIWQIEKPRTRSGTNSKPAAKWAELPEDAKHVFALAFGSDGRTLYAGTGPDGKLYAVGRDKTVSLYLDTDEEHILSILPEKRDSVVIGTSPGAKLLRVRGPGRAIALADFEGTEVKSIVGTKTDLFVAVNIFDTPPAVPKKSSAASSAVSGTKTRKKPTSKSKGASKIFKITKSVKQELLLEESKSHVVSMAVAKNGKLYVGFGKKGRVTEIDTDRVTRTALDLEERQVTSIVATDRLEFVATGDTGAAYRIVPAPKSDATYYSPPLNTESTSSWGALRWHATGPLVVQSRSGNTKLPGKDWSDWSKPIANGQSPKSPRARYIQLRISFAKNPKTRLISAELAFKPQNMRAKITQFDPDSPYPKTRASKVKSENFVSERTAKASRMSNEKELDLTWSVDNPDDDKLRYSLWYRALGEALWRPITRDDEILTAKRYTWKTRSIPEGRYQLRLRADDSPDNGPEATLADEFISVPVLVDNHPPEVRRLNRTGRTLKGLASDSFSQISLLDFSVDAGPWFPIFCKDGVLDEMKEDFEFTLPTNVKAGLHAVSIRAFDRAGNMGNAEIHINIPAK